MNFAFFLHSLASDWNHGNAHFVRGVLAELVRRGHAVTTHEQADNWSVHNLVADQGADAATAFREVYPELADVSWTYKLAGTDTFADPDHADVAEAEAALDLDERLRGVEVVVVHEWTPPSVVAAVGRWRKRHDDVRLLFHDTHHRIVSEPAKMQRFDLDGYDGVLAFGDVLREAYAADSGGWGFGDRVWTWHEAADTHVFKPLDREAEGDLCWVGNWGDDERTAELHEFLLGPVRTLGLDATVHGVRYPDEAKAALENVGIRYGGYLPNFRAPELFARHKVTVHVPRRYYVTHLPGIPTIRPFEALACGIPLVCSPWSDAEHLFTPGEDFLMVETGDEMTQTLRRLIAEPDEAAALAERGRAAVLARHTCGHRVDELLAVVEEIR